MLDLGLGSYLDMVEKRWGRVWSGLLMLVIYLTVLALCLPLIWRGLIIPAYGLSIGAVDVVISVAKALGQPGPLSHLAELLRTPTAGWHEVLRQLIALIIMGFLFVVGMTAYAVVLTFTLIFLAKVRGKPLDHYTKWITS